MPVYEYRCERGHLFDVIQRMADDPLRSCNECGAPVQRVFHPVAVHFKGSGFYSTDYGKNKSGAGDRNGGGDSSSSGSSSESDGSTKSSGSEKSSKEGAKATTSSGSDSGSGSSSSD